MKNTSFLILSVLAMMLFGACSTSKDVASNRFISKRKYTRGFHLNSTGVFRNKERIISDEEKTTVAVHNRVAVSSSGRVKEVVLPVVKSNGMHRNAEYDAVGSENEIDDEIDRSSVVDRTLAVEEIGVDIPLPIDGTTFSRQKKENTTVLNNDEFYVFDLVVILVLVILLALLLTLLNTLLGGLLSWLLGVVVLVLIIYFLLRLLGMV